jgi:hypothetical protein
MSAPPNPADERLVAFLASGDDPAGDPLRDPHLARTWCAEHGIDAGRRALTAPDLARLRALRAGLRGAIDAPTGAAARRLGALSRDARLGIEVGPSGPVLVPGTAGIDGVIGRLALDAVDATARGTWGRVRVCAAPECARVFLDTTRARNRAWCDMTTCGNRSKVRAHRARARGSEA